MRMFPMGFLKSFLVAQNVSCSLCSESRRKIGKHSIETLVNIDDAGFPALETSHPMGNFEFPLGFLEGFL